MAEADAVGWPMVSGSHDGGRQLPAPNTPECSGPQTITEGVADVEGPQPPVDVVGLLGGRPVGPAAEAALRRASLVAGGRDQLAAVADLIGPGARTLVVGAGMGALDEVAASDEAACVLASGDPGFFGVLRPLLRRMAPGRVVVHPAPSSVALAFARLGLAWDRAVVRSCHTGEAARVAAEVARAPVAAVLCGPEAPPETLGAALLGLGASHRTVAVASRLGEPGEQVQRCADVAWLAAGTFDPRSVVVLARPDAAPVAPAARPGGRPVTSFAHRASMITKPEVRSVVLGKLDLPEQGVLWDVGAGSGSVAIEAALAAPGLRVVAVEQNPADAARVLANAAHAGALVEVVEGAAPAALVGLPTPDRVFVGGGGLDVLDAAVDALAPGGRIVATFAAVDRAARAHHLLGSLVQVGIHRAELLPDGGVRFAADNPVFVAWGDRPPEPSAAPAGRVAVGVGCSSAATADEVARAVAEAFADAGLPDDPVPSEGPGGHFRGSRASEEPAGSFPTDLVTQRSEDLGRGRSAPQRGTSAAGSASAEQRDHMRGSRSTDEPAGSVPTDLVTQRNQGFDGGLPARQRGNVAGATEVVLATIDRRLRHPAIVEAAAGRPVIAFPPSLLGLVEVPDPSQVVDDAVGTPSVAEAAALLAAGPGARLVTGKRRGTTTTTAVAFGPRPLAGAGRVQVVGLGPGHPSHRTPAATTAVRQADAVVGYRAYVDVAEALLRPDQLVVRSGMGAEAERALAALALAGAGWRVALVTSGDPGVFAMASATLELAAESATAVAVDVVPGLTASSAAAAAVGAPLAGPHAVLTLSDLLVPWTTIEAQLRAAAGAGMALALYNPRSAGRPDHLDRARKVLLEVLDPSTPVACVTAATDAEEHVARTTLEDLDPAVAGMRSLVIVGTLDTVDAGGRLLTRRHHPRPKMTP